MKAKKISDFKVTCTLYSIQFLLFFKKFCWWNECCADRMGKIEVSLRSSKFWMESMNPTSGVHN